MRRVRHPAIWTDILTQNFVAQHPDRARILLVANPQLVFAMLQAMIVNHIIDPNVLSRLQDVVDNKTANGIPPPGVWQGGSYYPPPPAAAMAPPPAAAPESALLDPQQQANTFPISSGRHAKFSV